MREYLENIIPAAFVAIIIACVIVHVWRGEIEERKRRAERAKDAEERSKEFNRKWREEHDRRNRIIDLFENHRPRDASNSHIDQESR